MPGSACATHVATRETRHDLVKIGTTAYWSQVREGLQGNLARENHVHITGDLFDDDAGD